MPDVDTEDDTKLDQPEGEVNDGEEPESSGVVADVVADVPTLQAKKKETKGKKGGRSLVKGTKRPLNNESEDDAEIGNMIKQLSQQQKAAASIQGRIEGFLTKDQQSSAAAWGTWMGTLAQQIDVCLHPAMYRQVTDMMLDFITQSAKLPTHVPGQEIFIPIPPPNPLQPQQQVNKTHVQHPLRSICPCLSATYLVRVSLQLMEVCLRCFCKPRIKVQRITHEVHARKNKKTKKRFQLEPPPAKKDQYISFFRYKRFF